MTLVFIVDRRWGTVLGAEKSDKDVQLSSWAKQVVGNFGYLWGSDLEELSSAAVLAETLRRSEGFKFRRTAGFKVTLVSLALSAPVGLVTVAPAELQASLMSLLLNLLGLTLVGSVIGMGMMLWADFTWSPSDQPGWKSLYMAVHQALWREIELERRRLLYFGANSTRANPPKPLPKGVSHVGAESLCAEWMNFLGEDKVAVTSATADGGIDIVSSLSVAQVKNYSGSVGVAPVRELVGVASVDGRKPMFFTSGTYTQGAVTLADKAGVALFIYSAERGTLDPANLIAKKRLDQLGKKQADSRNISGASKQGADPKSSQSSKTAGNFSSGVKPRKQEGARVTPPTRPRVRSSPAHCPRCDYAPAPEEERCSECGFYFLLNRF